MPVRPFKLSTVVQGVPVPLAPENLASMDRSALGTIVHFDMDAFFASVEILERPELATRPMFVAGAGARSVVTSANYPARAYGVRSAMPVGQARRLCPQAVLVEPQSEKYRYYSRKFFDVLSEITPQVEKLSIDEAFLDITGSLKRLGDPLSIVLEAREEIFRQTGLSASAGLAPNKFLAKIGSTRIKPEGVLVIPKSEAAAFVRSLNVSALWGVGAKTREKLATLGITSVEDLATTPVHTLQKSLGQIGVRLHELAMGRDASEVKTTRVEKSISAEHTFDIDSEDIDLLQENLLRLSVKVGARARRAGYDATKVSLKVRYADFTTLTRTHTLPTPSANTMEIYSNAQLLFAKILPLSASVRLIGVQVEGLQPHLTSMRQFTLGGHEEQWESAERAADAVAEKFSNSALIPASLLSAKSAKKRRRD